MKKYTFYILIIIILSSCVTMRPDAVSISEPDYNKRKTVHNAHYDHVLTPIGVGSMVVAAGIGSVAGYKSNMFTYYDENTQKKIGVGGMLIGGSTSFIIARYLNQAFGWGKITYPETAQKWVEDVNKEYKYTRTIDAENFVIIHQSVEANYIVKNIQDAKDFATAFPNSKYNDKIVSASASVVERDDIPELIILFNNANNLSLLKKQYIVLSTSTVECIEAKNKYSELNKDAEKKASEKICSYNDLKLFKDNYPSSSHMNSSIGNALKTVSYIEIPKITSLFSDRQYSNLSNLESAKNTYIQKSKSSLSLYIAATKKYPDIYTKKTIEKESANLVKSYTDASVFKNEFGAYSSYSNVTFSNALKYCSQNEIPYLLNLFKNIKYYNKENAKIEYIKLSKTPRDFISAIKKYPNTKLRIKTNINLNNLSDVKYLCSKLQRNRTTLGNMAISIENQVRDDFLYEKYNYASNRNLSAQEDFKQMLSQETFLDARNRKYNGSNRNYVSLIDNKINISKAKIEKQEMIDKYGKDYVVDSKMSNKNGWYWGSYKIYSLTFADGTTGVMYYDDGNFLLTSGRTKTDKHYYSSKREAEQGAYTYKKTGRIVGHTNTYEYLGGTTTSNSDYSNNNTSNSYPCWKSCEYEETRTVAAFDGNKYAVYKVECKDYSEEYIYYDHINKKWCIENNFGFDDCEDTKEEILRMACDCEE